VCAGPASRGRRPRTAHGHESRALKPSSDTRAQVVVHGRVRADMEAGDYHRYKTIAMGRCWSRMSGFAINAT
jgi:cobyric acid synthase